MIKKSLAFLLAIFLTLIIIKPYSQTGFPYTHDGENHLARFANYKIAVREGQIPPRFAPNLMNHYGYPVFNYNYPLANILSLPFSLLKINYEITFKILASLAVFLGLVGVVHWLEKLKLSLGAILFGVSCSALSPFLWSTLLYRGNIGEIMAWGLFPWLFYIVESLRSPKGWTFRFKGLLMTAFLLSHNITVLFGLPLMVIYAWLRHKTNQVFWLRFMATLGFGIALSLWFWLPAIAEKSLVNVGRGSLINDFGTHFPTLGELVFSPLRFGLSLPGSIDGLSFAIGMLQIATLIISGLILIKKAWKKNKIDANFKLLLLFFVGSICLIFFQLKLTLPVWKFIPLAAFVQFPWRLSLFLGSVGAGVGALVWMQISNRVRWFLIGVTIVQLISLMRLQPVDYFHREIIDYDAFSQSTSTTNENLPKDFDYTAVPITEYVRDWAPRPRLAVDKDLFSVIYWSGSKRIYQLKINEKTLITEPTFYFLGWETMVNGKFMPYAQMETTEGRIGYWLEPGKYEVTTQFTQKTWPRLIGNGVSMIALFIMLALIFRKFLSKDLNFYLNWKLFMLVVGAIAPMFLIYKPSFVYPPILFARSNLPQALYSWANFDGVHYITILQKGYLGTALIQAFFPLFSLLTAWVNKLVTNPILAGLLLNSVLGFLLLKAWKQLINRDIDVSLNRWGVHLLFLFPTAFFFNAFYSEALFLWLVLFSFVQARKGYWWQASLLAAAASATRVVGIFLIPALLVELWLQKVALKKSRGEISCCSLPEFIRLYWQQILLICSSSLGLFAYMWYLKLNFNDPLYFFHVQAEFGGGRQESLVLYPQVVWRYLKILWTARPFDLKYYAYVQEFIFGILGLGGIIWSWFKIRKSYVVFSALAFLLPTLTGTFSSLPRYYLVSFSALLLAVKLLEGKKFAQYVWLGVSTLWLIFNTILFIQGYWVA